MRAATSSGTPSFFSRLAIALAISAGFRSALARSSQLSIGLGMAPLATTLVTRFVKLAHHGRAHIGAPVVQLFFELVFNDLALFFHHQNFLQTLRKVARDAGFQRPHHVDLVQADAQAAGKWHRPAPGHAAPGACR